MTRSIAAVLAVLALTLSACASLPKFEAAGDVHDFLVSIRNADRAAFDAHVDKPALKAQLRARLLAETAKAKGGDSLQVLGALFAGPLVDAAADALIRPEVFRAVAEYLGYKPEQAIPDRFVIAQALRRIDTDRVCAVEKKSGPCVLTFQNEGGTWKLVGFDGDLGRLKPKR